VIYLDNSATTILDPEVLDAMMPWLTAGYGNASSIYKIGRSARVAIEQSRTEFAQLIGAHPAEIIFTSGGTESNNAVLKSCLVDSKLASSLVYSATEHHAVIHPAESLAQQGFDVHEASVDALGKVDLEALAKRPLEHALVSIMHANNETGVIQPLTAIRTVIKDALLHSDAVQSFGKVPIDVGRLPVDFLSFSAHKLHGPKGVGAMFIRKGIDFKAHQQGGGQERNRRAGTEPVALIVGMVTAARLAAEQMDHRTQHMRMCIATAREMITSMIPNVRFNTPTDDALPNILNVSFLDAEKLDGESILQAMDIAGVAVSNGSACVSGSLQPSHVLKAMGLPEFEARAAVRLSVSKDTSIDEVLMACTLLSEIIRNMRV
jgi:cysteine desulfurase